MVQDAGSLATPGRRDKWEDCHQKPEGEGLQAVRATPQGGAGTWTPAFTAGFLLPDPWLTSRHVTSRGSRGARWGLCMWSKGTICWGWKQEDPHLVRTPCWGHTELGSRLNYASHFLRRATVHTNLEGFEPLQHLSARCRGKPRNLVS